MRGSKFFVRRGVGVGGGGGGGGGVVDARRPENGLDNVFLAILLYNLQSGSNGFITEGRRGSNFFRGVGGVQRNPYNL